MLHFPCAAGVGRVVEVGTACRHGSPHSQKQLAQWAVDRTAEGIEPIFMNPEPIEDCSRVVYSLNTIKVIESLERLSPFCTKVTWCSNTLLYDHLFLPADFEVVCDNSA